MIFSLSCSWKKSVVESDEYSIELFRDLNAVPISHWKQIVPEDRQFLHLPYMRVVENSHRGYMEFFHAIFYKEGKPVGGAYFQLVEFVGSELRSYLPDENHDGVWYTLNRRLNGLLDCALGNMQWKLLVTGNLLVTGENGLIMTNDIDQDTALNLVHQAAVRLSEEYESISAVLVSDLYDKHVNGGQPLQEKKYRQFAVEPDLVMYLDEEWETFDDYLDSITSKYRVRARKVFKESDPLEIRELNADEVGHYRREIYMLYQNVTSKAKFKLGDIEFDYFMNVKKALGSNFRIFGYFFENKMVGFISAFVMDNKTEVHYVGLDYDYNQKYRIYHRMLFENVRLGIEHNSAFIRFGRTATEIKTTIGAVPENMYCLLRHTNRISNLAIKPLSNYLKPDEWIQRNPFRKQPLAKQKLAGQ